MLKPGRFGNEITYTWKDFTRGAGEGWRSAGPIVKEMKKYYRVKEERNILHTINRRKTNWIGHILRRNCHLNTSLEKKTEGTGRRGRSSKQLLDDLKWKKKVLEIERGSTRRHCVENLHWKRTDCRMVGDDVGRPELAHHLDLWRDPQNTMHNSGNTRGNKRLYQLL